MPKSLQALREKRHAKGKEARNLLDPAVTAWTKETSEKVDAIYAEIDLIDDQIRKIERMMQEDESGAANVNVLAAQAGISTDEAKHKVDAARKAFVKALRYGAQGLTQEELALVSANSPANRSRVQNVAEGSPSTGGYLVPTIIMPQLLIKLKYFGGMRAVADSLSTANGYPISWGTTDDTTNTGEIVAENVVASNSDIAFGNVTINAWKFSSKIVPVSLEILQDAAVDVEARVLDLLTIRIGRAQNTYFTNGSGTNQPQGALTGAALGVTLPTGNTTSITYNGIVDLYHALDLAYRVSDRCAFMMHDLTFKAVKKLVDSQGRPLWLPLTSPSFQSDSQFDTLLGKKLVINNDMPQMAANAQPILFGDFSKYLIRDVMDILVLRFTDSAYASKGQVGFLAWARADGRLVDASNQSILYLANSAT